MKRKNLFAILIFLVAACLFSLRAFSAAPAHDSPEGKQIVALVDKAAALVESKGKEAFPELKKDKKWYNDKTYVFVDGMDGLVLVNPPSPEIEGKNLLDWKDAKGKQIVREFIRLGKTKGSGWVDYYWPKPGEQKPSKKMSYVKKAKLPTGEEVIVGAGIYGE
jgi:cytochrome c